MEVEEKLWRCIRDGDRLVVAVREESAQVCGPGADVEVVVGTRSFEAFSRVYGPVAVPSYTVVGGGTRQARSQGRGQVRGQCGSEKKRVLDLIAADRLERESKRRCGRAIAGTVELVDKFGRGRHLRETDMCTLQVRFTNGDSVKCAFESGTTLKAVREWLEAFRTDGEVPYVFHRNIPRMDYKPEDELKTLRELDLAPRSILMMRPNDARPRTRLEKYRRKNNSSSTTGRRNSMLKVFIAKLKRYWVDIDGQKNSPAETIGSKVSSFGGQPTDPLAHKASTEISNNSAYGGEHTV